MLAGFWHLWHFQPSPSTGALYLPSFSAFTFQLSVPFSGLGHALFPEAGMADKWGGSEASCLALVWVNSRQGPLALQRICVRTSHSVMEASFLVPGTSYPVPRGFLSCPPQRSPSHGPHLVSGSLYRTLPCPDVLRLWPISTPETTGPCSG